MQQGNLVAKERNEAGLKVYVESQGVTKESEMSYT